MPAIAGVGIEANALLLAFSLVGDDGAVHAGVLALRSASLTLCCAFGSLRWTSFGYLAYRLLRFPWERAIHSKGKGGSASVIMALRAWATTRLPLPTKSSPASRAPGFSDTPTLRDHSAMLNLAAFLQWRRTAACRQDSSTRRRSEVLQRDQRRWRVSFRRYRCPIGLPLARRRRSL